MPYINFTFVYWIILKETILNLLDPSSTTSLVGKVIVCSLGEMSARGGLFTRGAKQVHIQNEQERDSEHVSTLCQKDHSQQGKLGKESSENSTQDKLAEVWRNDHDQVVIGFKLPSDRSTRTFVVIEGSKVHCNSWEWPPSNFSSQYHPWINHDDNENKGNDCQFKKLLIVKQILLVITMENVENSMENMKVHVRV